MGAAAAGDSEAFAELWRRHYEAGLRAAHQYRGLAEPEDVVQEAFTQILIGIARGVRPTGAFRPYLYVVIRNLAVSNSRRRRPSPVGDSNDVADQATPSVEDPAGQAIERALADEAFRRLPQSWQEVLWYSTVEDLPPHDVGRMLGLTANAASALAVRAREGLRREWLAAHVRAAPDRPRCQACLESLPAYVRGRLPPAKAEAVRGHLARCVTCSTAQAEMVDVAGRLRALWVPWLVATPVVGPVADAVAGTASVAREGIVARAIRPRGPGGGSGARAVSLSSVAAAVVVVVVGALTPLTGRVQALPLAEPVATASPEPGADGAEEGTVPPGPSPSGPEDDGGETEPEDPLASDPLSPEGPAAGGPEAQPGGPGAVGAPAAPEQSDPIPAPTLEGPAPGWVVTLPRVGGTAVPGATVTVLANGVAVGTAVADASGAWTATPPTSGAGRFEIAARQGEGASAPTSPALGPYTVETPQISGAANGALTLVRSPVGAMGPNEITVTVAGRAGASYAYAFDGVEPFGPRQLSASGTGSITQVNAPPGTHTIALRYVDPVTGARGPQSAFVVTIV